LMNICDPQPQGHSQVNAIATKIKLIPNIILLVLIGIDWTQFIYLLRCRTGFHETI
jgi:hypothetical protein